MPLKSRDKSSARVYQRAPIGGPVKRDIQRLDASIRIPRTNSQPSDSHGNDGDMLLGNFLGSSVLYIKIQNKWEYVTLSKASRSQRNSSGALVDPSNATPSSGAGGYSFDTGWFTIKDSNDSDQLEAQSTYRVEHNSNCDLVNTDIFCRFEGLKNGEPKTYVINLNSHISHSGPNSSRYGYWVDIIDKNTLDLHIHPDGLTILHSEQLKDTSSNTSMLLSSKDGTNTGSVEIRMLVKPLKSSGGTKPKLKGSRAKSLNESVDSRNNKMSTGNSIIGSGGASVDGTKNDSFSIDSDGTGVLLKNDSGVLKVRNLANDADAEVKASKLTVSAVAAAANEVGKGSSDNKFLTVHDGSNLYHTVMVNNSAVVQTSGGGTALKIADNNLFVIDNSDNTKLLDFQLSGITSGNTRTLTIPDASGTIALTSDSDSAYSGVVGYTYIQPTSTATFEIQDSMTVEDAAHKITFKTPPSENVEVELSCFINVTSTDTNIDVGLSDNSTYNSIGGQFEYDFAGVYLSDDEADDDILTIKWVLSASELASVGSDNTFYVGFSTAGSTKTAYLAYGFRSSHGVSYPPFIMKATALPSTIYDGS